MKFNIFVIVLLVISVVIIGLVSKNKIVKYNQNRQTSFPTSANATNLNPLTIAAMRDKSYPGSSIVIKQKLGSVGNYNEYIASYISDGLKIYALLTVPVGQRPTGGWPVILFNHGYIPPGKYSTQESYQPMVSPLASAGYIVFMPDYRGNGNSQGKPEQPYVSPSYMTDSMNALSSIKKYKDANPDRIGVLGHSMGGNVTLHDLVITHAFKAAVILSGVVGNEEDLLNWWSRRRAQNIIVGNDLDTYYALQQILRQNGNPNTNPNFWNLLDPTNFISDISAPIQIQVGTADNVVPPNFSPSLRDKLQGNAKTVDYRQYLGADHNLSPDLGIAMQASIDFFNKYLR